MAKAGNASKAASVTSNTAWGKATTGMVTFEASAGRAGATLRRTGQDGADAADKARRAAEAYAKTLGDLHNKAGEVASSVKTVGLVTAGVGLGMVASLYKPIEAFGETERAFTNLDIAFGTKSANPYLSAIKKQAIDLGVALEGTANDYASVAIAMGRKGLSPEVITGGGLKAMSHLAVLTEMNKAEAGALGAELSNAWGIAGSKFNDFSNLLQKGALGLGVDLGGFNYFSHYVAPQAAALKMTGLDAAKEHMAIAAVLTQKGMEPASAGEGMKQLYMNLALMGGKMAHGRGWKIKGAEGLMAQYGIKPDFFNQKGQFEGLGQLLVWMDGTRKKFGENAQGFSQFVQSAFGEQAATVLQMMSLEGFNDKIRKLNDRQDIDVLMKKRTDSQVSLWKQATGTITMFFSAIGEKIAPEVKSLLRSLQAIASKLKAWTDEHPNLTRVIVFTVAAVGLLAIGVGGLLIGIGFLGTAFLSGITFVANWKEMLFLARSSVRGLGRDAIIAAGEVQALAVAQEESASVNALLGMKAAGTAVTSVSTAAAASSSAAGGAIAAGSGGVLGSALGWLGGVDEGLGAVIAGIGWPVVLIVLALAAAGLLIYRNWKPVKTFFLDLWSGIRDGSGQMDFIWALFPLIGLPILIIRHWEKVKAFFKGFGSGFRTEFTDKVLPDLQSIKTAGEDTLGDLETLIKSLFAPLGELAAMFHSTSSAAGGTAESVANVNKAFEIGKFVASAYVFEIRLIVKEFHLALLVIRVVIAIIQNLVTVVVDAFMRPIKLIHAFWTAFEASRKAGKGRLEAFEEGNAAANKTNGELRKTSLADLAAPWKSVGSGFKQWATWNPQAKVAQTPLNHYGISGNAEVPGDEAEAPTIQKGLGKLIPASMPGPVSITYSPKVELHGTAGPEDEAKFMRILEKHKEDLAKMVQEIFDRRQAWNGAR